MFIFPGEQAIIIHSAYSFYSVFIECLPVPENSLFSMTCNGTLSSTASASSLHPTSFLE
jgi:hypothetical protein